MNRIFLIGNGQSRLQFPIEKLKGHGKIYGCNAIYRDYPDLIDVLTGVDHGICHEIYHSGYALKKPCYFRNWTKVPVHMYSMMVEGMASKQEVEDIKKYDLIKSNNQDDSTEFVMHGTNLKGLVGIIKKNNQIDRQQINKSQLYLSWIKEGDMSFDFRDIADGKDHGWACGATSGFIACKREHPDEVYMIGHDLYSDTEKINNIYASTQNYTAKNTPPTPAVNWVDQWRTLMGWTPDVKFYKVNLDGADTKTNRPLPEWSKLSNIEYMTHRQVLDKLGIS